MKTSINGFRENRLANIIPCLFLLSIFSTCVGYAADDRDTENSKYITFFKQTLASPHDIEHYVAKRTQLLHRSTTDTNSIQYFEGAISGTNFFLLNNSDPDRSTGANQNRPNLISARAGASTYEIGGHGLVIGIGTNGCTADVEVNFRMSRTVLGMGAGEIEPGTVKWQGNAFTAKNVMGKAVHGSLQVSNGLPARIELFLADKSLPYGAVNYTYPDPPDSFACYPARFVNFFHGASGLVPIAEVELKSLQLAKKHLDASYFSETRFSDLYTYTNVFSNSDYYLSRPKADQFIKANNLVQSGGITNSKLRKAIYLGFAFATLLPLGVLVAWLSQRNKQKQKNN